MKKTIKILFFISFLIIILSFIIFLYFYEFYTFKKIRLCISEEKTDLRISCENKEECIKFFIENNEELKKRINNLPDFAKEKISEILNEIISCENNCKIKKTYGSGFLGDGKEVNSCNEGEKEIIQKIRGKEAIALYKYLKNTKNF